MQLKLLGMIKMIKMLLLLLMLMMIPFISFHLVANNQRPGKKNLNYLCQYQVWTAEFFLSFNKIK